MERDKPAWLDHAEELLHNEPKVFDELRIITAVA
jgi:hypothetical protein